MTWTSFIGLFFRPVGGDVNGVKGSIEYMIAPSNNKSILSIKIYACYERGLGKGAGCGLSLF